MICLVFVKVNFSFLFVASSQEHLQEIRMFSFFYLGSRFHMASIVEHLILTFQIGLSQQYLEFLLILWPNAALCTVIHSSLTEFKHQTSSYQCLIILIKQTKFYLSIVMKDIFNCWLWQIISSYW